MGINKRIMIVARGPNSALAFLLADGASDEDVRQGHALAGKSERKLRKLLEDTGLKFDDFWRTALIKERINLLKPQANKGLLTNEYKRILLEEINSIRPNIIIP